MGGRKSYFKVAARGLGFCDVTLKRFKDRLAFDPFMLCHGSQDRVQSSNANADVSRNRNALVSRF